MKEIDIKEDLDEIAMLKWRIATLERILLRIEHHPAMLENYTLYIEELKEELKKLESEK